jgi:LysM repeat protein
VNLDKITTWVKTHRKQAGLAAAGVAVVVFALYRKRAAAAQQGLTVGIQPQLAGQDAAAGAYDQFTTALGQLTDQQQQQSGAIYDALSQLGQGLAAGQSSLADAMAANAAAQNAATGGLYDAIVSGVKQPASPAAPTHVSIPKQGVHTFTAGETIDSVARKYGVTVSQILAANPNSDKAFTAAGHRITVPTAAAPSSGPKPSIVYTPGKGESEASIAKKFGISVAQLKAANSKSGQPLATAGHRITIPGT